jgi:hypothetical protein
VQADHISQAQYKGLNTPTFKTKVDPKYFVKSPHYQRINLREIGKYVKARPGRFGAGLALGGAGLAGMGYGLHHLLKKDN